MEVTTFLLFLVGVILTPSGTDAGQVTDGLVSKLQSGNADAIVELPSTFQSVMSNPALTGLTGAAKKSKMVELMKSTTSLSQTPIMSAISGLGIQATPNWIANTITLHQVDLGSVQALSFLPGAFTVREPHMVSVNPALGGVVSGEKVLRREARQTQAQWGVSKIQAPAVWQAGYKGGNTIVANIDTGVFGQHEALVNNYGGQWYDPYYGTSTPDDQNGHGTHTMGTIAGQTYGIGVAPNARWIACRGLGDDGRGFEQYLTACGQWILNQGPSVVSNSWGGGQGSTWYNDIIKSWKAAGIKVIFSIGNSGPNCNTANSPGDQSNLISVGSTKSDDSMSSFSSRGYAVSGSIKPEVAAPGDNILSAWYTATNDYAYLSGTSMACPHVAGATALMLSKNPNLTQDQVLSALTKNTDKPTVSSNDLACGKNTTSTYPNNAYGFGRINVKRAMGL